MKKVKIGVVGVDSGQLIITDPCYLRDWKDEEFKGGDIYADAAGKTYGCALHGLTAKEVDVVFTRFDDVITIEGETGCVSNLISGGWLKKMPPLPPSRKYSYNGACQVSDRYGEEDGCQLNFEKGHAGAGVAVSTGWGDGCYAVYAEIDKDGRTARLIVDFTDGEDEREDEDGD
jgi:hypothetical protein